MDHDRWHDLLKSTIEEQHYWLAEHQKRVAFFSGFIVAALTATVAGALEASKPLHWFVLLSGPAVLVALSYLGNATSYLFYRQYAECLTVRAKLEQRLGYTRRLAPVAGLAAEGEVHEEPYWPDEPLLPARYLKLRKTGTSAKFIDAELKSRGYHLRARRFFYFFGALGLILAATFVVSAFT